MLSWRLWRALSEPAYKNPIFKRSCNERRQQSTQDTLKLPRHTSKLILLLIGLAVLHTPYILIFLFQIPAMMILVIVLTPLFLPLILMVYGGYLLSIITSYIHKEKRQYTYDLICASPDGALRANWIFATGIIHRGDWFYWVETLVNFTYRIGQIILIGLACLMIVTMLQSDGTTHFDSLQTLINLSLLLGLYYTSIMQTFVLILVVALYATSLDLHQRDSNLIGLVLYIILQIFPFLIATALFIGLHLMFPNPHPAVAIGLDFIVLGSIYATQELNIILGWHQLTKRLNSTTSSYAVGRTAPLHS